MAFIPVKPFDDVRDCMPLRANSINFVRQLLCGTVFKSRPLMQNCLPIELPDGQLEFTSTTQLLAGRFRFLCHEASGGSSQLIKCIDTYSKGNRVVAIKILLPGYEAVGLEEYDRLVQAGMIDNEDDVNVVRCYGRFSLLGRVCIVFEELQHSLEDLCGYTPDKVANSTQLQVMGTVDDYEREKKFRKLSFQIFKGLAYLHARKIVHADIKPGNILSSCENNHQRSYLSHVKLVDVGNSFDLTNAKNYSTDFEVQSLGYRAPEVLCGVTDCLTPNIDVWSAGIVLIELAANRRFVVATKPSSALNIITEAFGELPQYLYNEAKFRHRLPARSHSTQETTFHSTTQQFLNEFTRFRSVELLDFLACAVRLDPRERPTAFDLLQHPFLHRLFPLRLLQPPISKQASQLPQATKPSGSSTLKRLFEDRSHTSDSQLKSGKRKKIKSGLLSLASNPMLPSPRKPYI